MRTSQQVLQTARDNQKKLDRPEGIWRTDKVRCCGGC